LPADVYNGMVPMLLKNLVSAASGIVHIVAFTPKPRLIQLEMVPADTQRLVAGEGSWFRRFQGGPYGGPLMHGDRGSDQLCGCDGQSPGDHAIVP